DQKLVPDYAQAEEIVAGVGGFASALLDGHVERRAAAAKNGGLGRCTARPPDGTGTPPPGPARGGDPPDSKVTPPDVGTADQNVRRLEIAMDQSLAMGKGQGLGHLPHELERDSRPKAATRLLTRGGQVAGQVATSNVFVDQKRGQDFERVAIE